MPKKTNKRKKKKAHYHHLPKQVSKKSFTHYILPHLSKATRGPKTKVSLYKIFNYILRVLTTGMQWDQLATYKNEISWQRIYAKHSRWSKDGSYQKLFEASVINLFDTSQLDVSTLHGDGSNTVVKKGGAESDIRDTNIKRAIKS